MHNSKIRTGVTALLAVAALAGAGLPSAASARAAKRVTAGSVLHVRQMPVHAALEAGGAGIPGYGDAECEGLAHDYDTAVTASEQGLLANDTERANMNGELAHRIHTQLTDNCMVID